MKTTLIFRKNLKHLSANTREYCAPYFEEPYRFVLLNNTLYLGDFRFHVQLAIAATLGDVPGLATELTQQKESYWQQKLRDSISAAGILDTEGNISSWKSSGFNVVTPEKMRSTLSKLIQQVLSAF